MRPDQSSQNLKVYVFGERSGDPFMWDHPGGISSSQLVIATSPEEASRLIDSDWCKPSDAVEVDMSRPAFLAYIPSSDG